MKPLPVTASAALFALAAMGCSLGKGEGVVHSDALYVKDCVLPTEGALCPYELPSGEQGIDEGCDNYDLLPDFFAAVPSENTLQLRIQRGTDITELSDGLAVVVYDVPTIRDVLDGKRKIAMTAGATEDEALESEYVEIPVAMPAGVTTPGSAPSEPAPCDASTQLCDVTPVAMALYLQKSCHNQNSTLYALSGTVQVSSLYSGDTVEKNAVDKLIYVRSFDVKMADPRDAPAGVPIGPDSVPPEKTSQLVGNFRFYFERGKPAQPF